MDIFPGHVTFDDLFKQSDWLLRLPLVCFDYFRVNLLLSHKKNLTFFQVLFIFSHIQNLTNFDIDSYMVTDPPGWHPLKTMQNRPHLQHCVKFHNIH